MNKRNLIPAIEFCVSHDIEISFINTLEKAGLIEIIKVKETEYIYETQLPELEKIIRFYYDLDINLEGIETVNYLLQRVTELQEEINILKNRLRLYEGSEFISDS